MSRIIHLRAPLLWMVAPVSVGFAVGNHPGLGCPIELTIAAIFSVIALAATFVPTLSRFWSVAFTFAVVLAAHAHYRTGLNHSVDPVDFPAREAEVEIEVTRPAARMFLSSESGFAQVKVAPSHLKRLVGQRVYYSVKSRAENRPLLRTEVILVRGELSSLERTGGPDDHLNRLLRPMGVNLILKRARILRDVAPPTKYAVDCEQIAQKLAHIFGRGLERAPDLLRIYRAMMLGQKTDLLSEQKELFIRSGTMHLFAINGLHIGIVAVSIHAFLLILRCPRAVASCLVLGVLWLDVEATGASPSSLRAFIMVAAVELSRFFRRPSNPLASWSLAALVALIIDPIAINSASFQMSYGVVATILTLGLPLASFLQRHYAPFADFPRASWRWHHWTRFTVAQHFLSAIAMGTSAGLIGSITGVIFFHTFVPLGIASNLILIPLATLVIIAGFLSALFGVMGVASLSGFFNHASGVVIWVIDRLIKLIVQIPFGSWHAEFRAEWIGYAAMVIFLISCFSGAHYRWRKLWLCMAPPLIAGSTLIGGTVLSASI